MIPASYAHLPPLISINKAADATGVSRRTVYNWMAAGKIQWVVTPSGVRQVVTDSLWRRPGDAVPAAVDATGNSSTARS